MRCRGGDDGGGDAGSSGAYRQRGCCPAPTRAPTPQPLRWWCPPPRASPVSSPSSLLFLLFFLLFLFSFLALFPSPFFSSAPSFSFGRWLFLRLRVGGLCRPCLGALPWCFAGGVRGVRVCVCVRGPCVSVRGECGVWALGWLCLASYWASFPDLGQFLVSQRIQTVWLSEGYPWTPCGRGSPPVVSYLGLECF